MAISVPLRHELKFFINPLEYEVLSRVLDRTLHRDSNGDENNEYAIRSLYACGVDGIVLSPRNWMSAAGVVCRSSAGASELLPMYTCDGVEAAGIFRDRGYKICCAGIRDSVSSFDADLTCPLFLIVGGEKRGISRALLDTADTVVRIDYGREFAGSLSAASAASMLGYEVLRQNRK